MPETPARIEVPVDGSAAAEAAVEHAAGIARERGCGVRLFHMLGPIPPRLLEHGGASDPEEEARRRETHLRRIDGWVEEERNRAKPMVERMMDLLASHGVDPEQVQYEMEAAVPEDDLAHLVRDDARKAGCDRIVVGRGTWPWVQEVFQTHLHESLEKLEDPDLPVEVVDAVEAG